MHGGYMIATTSVLYKISEKKIQFSYPQSDMFLMRFRKKNK